MSAKPSYYRIDRTIRADHAGDLSGASFITSDRDRLIGELPTAISGGETPEDSLLCAWVSSLEAEKNHLADFWISDLFVFDASGKFRTIKIVPDVEIQRGAERLIVEVIPGPNATFSFSVATSSDDDATPYLSLTAIGDDDALLAPLRASDQKLEVRIDSTRLVERIPVLGGDGLSGALIFRPFHDSDEFRDFVRDDLPDELAAKLPGGRDWDGHVPLETWFPASDLLEACDDGGCGNFEYW